MSNLWNLTSSLSNDMIVESACGGSGHAIAIYKFKNGKYKQILLDRSGNDHINIIKEKNTYKVINFAAEFFSLIDLKPSPNHYLKLGSPESLQPYNVCSDQVVLSLA